MGLTRLLFFAAIGVLAYFTWRRVQAFLDAKGENQKMAKRGDGRTMNEMEKCAVCGTYVASGVGRCMRADCPRR